MTTENKLDKSFGSTGTTAGIILLITGVITTFTTLFGLVLVILGAFLGFSSTSTLIDFDKRRIKYSNNFFGVIKTGKWIQINSAMKLAVRDSAITWSTFSRGNRVLDIVDKDFRIILLDLDNHEIMQVKKTETFDLAKAELEILCSKLKLNTVE